jgi:hypothetical protein
MGLLLLLMMTIKMMKNMTGRTHLWSEDNADKVTNVNDAVKDKAQEDKVAFVTEITAFTESQLRRSMYCHKLPKGWFPIQ